MSENKTNFGAGWWAHNLNEVDQEVARLAAICRVPLLQPGVVERVLGNDPSVCGTSNPLAFEKLRNLLMMHYAVRSRAAESLGQGETQILVNQTVERLRKQFGDRLGEPLPGG